MRRKWELAVALLVVTAACEGDRAVVVRPETPATAAIEVPVVADFSVARAIPGETLTTVGSESLRAGRGGVAIFAVERPRVPPRCIVDARLRLFVTDMSGTLAEELAVYPSHVFDAARKTDGERFGYSGSLLDVRPRALYEDGGGGWSEWRVTAIVKRWLSGRPFPSLDKRVPERGPVVLALRDAEGAQPFAEIEVASADSASDVPHMVVSAREGCVRGRA